MQHLQPNSTLQGGKYRIERVLGQGGFGITYLAEQVMLNRKVAIKEFYYKEYCERDDATSHVTLGTQTSATIVQRFLQKFLKEARTISQLDHPNIVKIHDIFEENNTAYYVMDYIEGESLSDVVKREGVLPEVTAIEYIKEVASALGYIHSKSINHLDVKPANIMLRKSDNQVLLIDFGLSKQYDEIGSQTSSTPVGISQGYAPIEQYRAGGVSTFSPQTDIYSLGATLYWLVIGKTPPAADEILDEGMPALPASISEAVKNAITSAMQARKKDRPESVEKWLKILSIVPRTAKKDEIYSQIQTSPIDDQSTMLLGQEWENGDDSEAGFDVTQYIVPTKYKENLTNTNKLANDGDVEAMFAMAIMYLRGEEKFQSFEEAQMWLSKCRDNGDERAEEILDNWELTIDTLKQPESEEKDIEVESGDADQEDSNTVIDGPNGCGFFVNGEYVNTKNTSVHLYTLNGCGTTFKGHYREVESTYVAYEFLCILFLPLIPIGCYRIRDAGSNTYNIYGSTEWHMNEVIMVYIKWWVGAFILLGIFVFISNH